MPQELLKAAQHHLRYAQVQNRTGPFITPYLDVFGSNDAASALQLAPSRDAGLLTFGLNRTVKEGHLDLARQLLEADAKWDAMTVQRACMSLEAVEMLVEFGFDVNTGLIRGAVLLPSGWILNVAAASCTPETFALLLSYGADISNAIPLHYAAGHGKSLDNLASSSRIPMLEYLVGLGIDTNSLDDAITIAADGRGRDGTLLQYAIVWGRAEEAKWLLDHGADPDKMSTFGISARSRVKRLRPDDEISFTAN
ncbi:hypothetical protein EJ02DRAFT_509769 [Clathrospora elynae]|uniref:Uncharacterized protein n=1 Tax=Clathrospora elynae TaxID=706981 RepID=A0A6A5T079_9PLEO|nr:hypothetical protein EJ02DRAFT_509769 [Clathrospora elynae]